MDLLPNTLFGPEPEVMVAGLPVRKVIGHHPPGPARPDDVKNPVHDAPPRVLGGASAKGHFVAFGKKLAKDLPFAFRQAARVTRHSKLLQYLTEIVQIKNADREYFSDSLLENRAKDWSGIGMQTNLATLFSVNIREQRDSSSLGKK